MPGDRYIEDEDNSVKVDIEVEGQTGEVDFDTLKSGGIIKQRQKDQFTVRLKCPGGRVPLERIEKAAEVARQYGGDYVHLSYRQSVEIPYVNTGDLDAVKEDLARVGQEIASCGPRVRVPTACSGCEYNPNGLMDTQSQALDICEKFFGEGDLVHKFKISFSGCPIDCSRTNEMDLGFQGAVDPEWDQDSCIGCEICAEACPEGAIEADEETGEPVYYPHRCLYCAECIRACPTGAWMEEKRGWIVRVGGKHGRHPRHGQAIAAFLPDQKVEEVVAAILSWYEENGRGQGRTRISTLLLDDETWEKFLRDIRPVLGEWAIDDPLQPRANEIHNMPLP